MYKTILFLETNYLRLSTLNTLHAGFYFTYLYIFTSLYIYIYMCVCVCVCACVRSWVRARDDPVKYYGK
jgi:hypothetical protein